MSGLLLSPATEAVHGTPGLSIIVGASMVQVDGSSPGTSSPVIAAGVNVPRHFTATVAAVFEHALNLHIAGDPMIVALVTRRGGLSARGLLVEHLPPGLKGGDRVKAVDGVLYTVSASATRMAGDRRPGAGLSAGNSEGVAGVSGWDFNRATPYDGRVAVTGEDNRLEIDSEMRHTLPRSAAAALRHVLSESCGEKGGFASILGIGVPDAFASKAARALAEGRGEACIGLGIGLTPSGDDFLTGVLLTQRLLGSSPPSVSSDRVAEQAIDPAATTDVSRTQLLLAVEGHAPGFLLPLFESLAAASAGTEDTAALFDAARKAVAHGHSSGCDAVAGVVWAIEASESAESLSRAGR